MASEMTKARVLVAPSGAMPACLRTAEPMPSTEMRQGTSIVCSPGAGVVTVAVTWARSEV